MISVNDLSLELRCDMKNTDSLASIIPFHHELF